MSSAGRSPSPHTKHTPNAEECARERPPRGTCSSEGRNRDDTPVPVSRAREGSRDDVPLGGSAGHKSTRDAAVDVITPLTFTLTPVGDDYLSFDIADGVTKLYDVARSGTASISKWEVVDMKKKRYCTVEITRDAVSGFAGMNGVILDAHGAKIGGITHVPDSVSRGRLVLVELVDGTSSTVLIPTVGAVHEGALYEISSVSDTKGDGFRLDWPSVSTDERASKILHVPLERNEKLICNIDASIDHRMLYGAAILLSTADMIPLANCMPKFGKSRGRGRARIYDGGDEIIFRTSGCDAGHAFKRVLKENCWAVIDGRAITIDATSCFAKLSMPNEKATSVVSELIGTGGPGSEIAQLKRRIDELEQMLAKKAPACDCKTKEKCEAKAVSTSTASGVAPDKVPRQARKVKGALVVRATTAAGIDKVLEDTADLTIDDASSVSMMKKPLAESCTTEEAECAEMSCPDEYAGEESDDVLELRARCDYASAAVAFLSVKLRCARFGKAAVGNEELYGYLELLTAIVSAGRNVLNHRSMAVDAKTKLAGEALECVSREVSEMDSLMDKLRDVDPTVRRAAVVARTAIPLVRSLLSQELQKIQSQISEAAENA